MRREIIAAAMAATLCVALIPAVAQEPRPAAGNAQFRRELLQVPDYGPIQPMPGTVRQPIISVAMSASEAVQIVQGRYPEARVLRARRLPNGDILVTMRVGNQVRRVRVDGGTGQIK